MAKEKSLSERMKADMIAECREASPCAAEIDLKECIERERCADPEFCAAYARQRLARKIALALARLRENAGLSRAELAAKAGLGVRTIARLENPHDHAKNLAALCAVAAALGADLDIIVEPRK